MGLITRLRINHEVGSISTHYSNENTESEPTHCSQPAFIKKDGHASLLLEGLGGVCRNGNKQIELTIRCTPSIESTMNCELYTDYIKLSAKKLDNRK